ncbi:MAG: transposase [Desulfovibrio sp.]|nr:transposase [Desulfovibrio sp.]
MEDLAPPKQLLHFVRRHWAIENELHNVRDMTFDEDRCRVRNHRKAQILAAIRNAAITMLRRAGFINIAEGREWYSEDRKRVLYLLLGRTE